MPSAISTAVVISTHRSLTSLNYLINTTIDYLNYNVMNGGRPRRLA